VTFLRWLASSTDVLRMAARLRKEGRLPAMTSIWAVENPLTHHPSRMEAKASPQLGHQFCVMDALLVSSCNSSAQQDLQMA
jgi:hypothetical protein